MMTKILLVLTSAYMALGGSLNISNSIDGEKYKVRKESDIDSYVYDACMFMMNELDYTDLGVYNLMNFYQEVAQDDELTTVEKTLLINEVNMEEVIVNDYVVTYGFNENDELYYSYMAVEGV